jgi:hypothetical protein
MIEGVSVPVAGPSAIFPRGYLWFAPVWFAAAGGAIYLSRWPLWFRADCIAGLLVGFITLLAAISTLTFRAFAADKTGVRLGLPTSTRRRGRRRRQVKFLPWDQIDRVKIARRPGGVRLELLLGPNASLSARGFRNLPATRAVERVLLLLIPFWYLVSPTALTSPLYGPTRYRVKLYGTNVDEMRRAMRALAPPEVTVAVLVRRRLSVSSAPTASDQVQPASPV